MKTFVAKREEVQRSWYVVDAAGVSLGRLAVRIADVLRGKNKPTYTPHVDTGDFVIVVNAGQVALSGRKEEQKMYWSYSGYPGGLKQTSAARVRARHPERLVEHAVRGMLPRTKLGRAIYRKLKVYAGPEHPHEAQKPEPLSMNGGSGS